MLQSSGGIRELARGVLSAYRWRGPPMRLAANQHGGWAARRRGRRIRPCEARDLSVHDGGVPPHPTPPSQVRYVRLQRLLERRRGKHLPSLGRASSQRGLATVEVAVRFAQHAEWAVGREVFRMWRAGSMTLHPSARCTAPIPAWRRLARNSTRQRYLRSPQHWDLDHLRSRHGETRICPGSSRSALTLIACRRQQYASGVSPRRPPERRSQRQIIASESATIPSSTAQRLAISNALELDFLAEMNRERLPTTGPDAALETESRRCELASSMAKTAAPELKDISSETPGRYGYTA